jgi:hypothetical protein
MLRRVAQSATTSYSIWTSAEMKRLPSPTATASWMYGLVFRAFSIFSGEMFFPPEVMMSSFFRPVIHR